MDYSELTNELWQASEGGTAEWWPDGLTLTEWGWSCEDDSGCTFGINEAYAYFIAKGHAESYLIPLGWECVSNEKGICYWNKYDWNLKGVPSLPAALAYAQQQGATDETD